MDIAKIYVFRKKIIQDAPRGDAFSPKPLLKTERAPKGALPEPIHLKIPQEAAKEKGLPFAPPLLLSEASEEKVPRA